MNECKSVHIHCVSVCVCAFEADLPGYTSVVPGMTLQVGAAQLQLLLQLLPQFLRRRLQPELVFGELKGHHMRKKQTKETQKTIK